MRIGVFLAAVVLVGWAGVSWAGAPVPEIPTSAAPAVVAGISALVFVIRGYLKK